MFELLINQIDEYTILLQPRTKSLSLSVSNVRAGELFSSETDDAMYYLL